jgi:hypothetical protein
MRKIWPPLFEAVAPILSDEPCLAQPAFFCCCSGDGVSLRLFFARLRGAALARLFGDLRNSAARILAPALNARSSRDPWLGMARIIASLYFSIHSCSFSLSTTPVLSRPNRLNISATRNNRRTLYAPQGSWAMPPNELIPRVSPELSRGCNFWWQLMYNQFPSRIASPQALAAGC